METDSKDELFGAAEAPLRYPLIFDHKHYVPRLLWKQGEYQALFYLHSQTKFDVTPLIDIPEVGFDFETGEVAKTIDEHLEKFARRLAAKWSQMWAFVDLSLIDTNERMADGRHPVKFVFDDVRQRNALAIPVTGLRRDDAYQTAVLETITRDKSGVCIRLLVEEIVESDFETRLTTLLNRLKISASDCHLIIDLQAPSFEPLNGFTQIVLSVLRKIPYSKDWNTFTVCSTSFPQSMGQIKTGVQIVKRFDWLFYKHLLTLLGKDERKPAFGDYAISHPEHARKDPRLLKPAASLRYTIDDGWYIVKGSNVRDNGYAQYRKFCADLVGSGMFLANGFSDAGDYIRNCALGKVQPGNLTKWRRVGTNHHAEKVVFDLANLTAP